MDTLIRLEADELNNSLIDFIKSTFKGKKIAVHIYADEEMDETEYLLSDPIHK
jgi:secreted Zn-dependent insulinase-like peptidase